MLLSTPMPILPRPKMHLSLNKRLLFVRGQPLTVAVSGGGDSMTVLHALNYLYGRQYPGHLRAVTYHHGTGDFADASLSLVKSYCEELNVPLTVGYLDPASKIAKNDSKENFWRQHRYAFFDAAIEGRVVLAHHLDDAIETFVVSSLKGSPRVIPEVRGRYVRPFIRTLKADLKLWATTFGVPYMNDPSNSDGSNQRSRLRALMPGLYEVEPGLIRTVLSRYSS